MALVFILGTWFWTGLAIASDPYAPEAPCDESSAESSLSLAGEQPGEVAEGGDGTRTGECIGGGCSSSQANNYPTGTFSTNSSSFTTVATDIFPGDYAFYSVTQGFIYEWTLCASDQANAPYDSQLTVRSQNGAIVYCHSDDFCAGLDAKIRWTATFSGTCLVLVTEYPCQMDPVFFTTLRWRREIPGPVCPNGVCETGENDCNCPQDCNQACGDGCCTGSESCATCSQDCATGCGDGCCTGGETDCTCPQDCPVACGDGCCTGTETDCTCPQDCPAACGDGCCTGTETDCTCPQDCPPACGDGCCTGSEASCNCASDCGPPASEDCNDNNTSDECDIAGGTSQDVNPANGIPDECEGGNLTSAVSRKSNPGGAGGRCDLPIDLDLTSALITSEMRVDANDISLSRGITELVLAYGGPPSPTAVTLAEDASCPSPPSYGPYTGSSVMNCIALANSLTCTFTPGLENARTYRLTVPHGTATAYLEIRGLIGDLNADGRVNGTDRSGVVGIWTTSPGFSCITDINNDGRTNGADRSLAVGAWTSPARNCAP